MRFHLEDSVSNTVTQVQSQYGLSRMGFLNEYVQEQVDKLERCQVDFLPLKANYVWIFYPLTLNGYFSNNRITRSSNKRIII